MANKESANKRVDLKIIIALAVLGVAIIITGLFSGGSSTSTNQPETSSTSPVETETEDVVDTKDNQDLTVVEDNQDLVASEDDQVKVEPKKVKSIHQTKPKIAVPTKTDSKASKPSPPSVPKDETPPTVVENPTVEKLNLQLTSSFRKVLVKTNLDSVASYYIASKKPDCNDQDEVKWSKVVQNKIDSIKHSSWICVRARTSSDKPYQYQLIQVDLTKPTFYVRHQLSSIFVDAKPSNLASLAYRQTKTKPSCDDNDSAQTWKTLTAEEISNLKHNYWVCIRGQIREDGVFGYKLVKVNLKIKPVVSLKQEGARVLVDFSPKSVYNASWFKSRTKPNCSDKRLLATWRQFSDDAIGSFEDRDWVCVRGANTAYGYSLLQIDLTKPMIDLEQEGRQVAFKFSKDLLEEDPTIAERSHWGQVFDKQDCNPNNKNIHWQQIKLNKPADLNYGQYWVCTQTINRVGIENYQTLKVDVKPPVVRPSLSIEAIQHNNDFHLTFSQKAVSDKQYTTSSTKPNCRTQTGYAAVPQDDILPSLTTDDWVCVVATFNSAKYYLTKQVLSAPSISTVQYAASPENNTQRATLDVAFSPKEIHSEQFALTTEDNCDNVDWLPLQTGLIFTENDNVCLRARNDQSVWGYLIHRYVDKVAPTYSI